MAAAQVLGSAPCRPEERRDKLVKVLTISGCSTPATADIIHGAFSAVQSHHGRPAYKKNTATLGDVYVYYWDERDGPNFTGWWIGPEIGGDQVWAHHNDNAARVPPASGWQVPFGGDIDPGLRVRAVVVREDVGPPPDQMSFASKQPMPCMGGSGHPGAVEEHKPVATQAAQPAKPLQAVQSTLQAVQAAQAARAATQPARPVGPVQLAKGAPGAKGAQVQGSKGAQVQVGKGTQVQVGKGVQQTGKITPPCVAGKGQKGKPISPVQARPPQGPAQTAATQPAATQPAAAQQDGPASITPCVMQVTPADATRLLASGARVIKRVASLTSCAITPPNLHQQTAEGVAIRINGGAKQRKLASDALKEVLAGADPDDAVAGACGGLVLQHGLGNVIRRQWLSWRVEPLRAKAGGVTVRVGPKAVVVSSGTGPDAEPVSDDLRAPLEAAVEEAQALAEQTVEANAELKPQLTDVRAAIAPLMGQYGLMVRIAPRQGDSVPLHLLGPPAATGDAAALLWERFSQGKATACVLQAAGCVQAMNKAMGGDFERDLQNLETDCKVRVHQAETMLWIHGEDAAAVARSRTLLREMLQFYLPQDFRWMPGLPVAALDHLRGDMELRELILEPGNALALDREGTEGTAWLCGPACDKLQECIERVSKQA